MVRIKGGDREEREGVKCDVEARGRTGRGHWRLENLSAEEQRGVPREGVKCVGIGRNVGGDGGVLVGC